MAKIEINNSYEFMINLLPYYLRQHKEIQAFYKSISKLFDILNKNLETMSKQHLVDYAESDFLDDLGTLVEEKRNGESDARYRERIKIAFAKIFFIPTLDNILLLTKSFLGKYPNINAGWSTTGEPAMYTIDYIADTELNVSLLNDIDGLIGGGVRVVSNVYREYYKVSNLTNLHSSNNYHLVRYSVPVLLKDISKRIYNQTGDKTGEDNEFKGGK